MKGRLDGTVALVTGASSGIGESTALALARQGAAVALVSRRKDRLEKVLGRICKEDGKGVVIEADITDQQQAVSAIARVIKEFGRLDILVNNAGITILGPATETPTEEWKRMLSINVVGLIHMSHAALPHLISAARTSSRKVADLVNVSSIAGRHGFAGGGVYSLTKFGVNGFSESLRQEVKNQYVRVSVIEPGAVNTEWRNNVRPEVAALMARMFRGIDPLEPQDVADAIEFVVTRSRRACVDEIMVRPANG